MEGTPTPVTLNLYCVQLSSTLARGFPFSGGAYSTFAAPGATTTIPFGINNSGQIVGYAIGPGLTTSGFIYSGETFTLINVVAPPALTWGYGINDQEQIVGAYAAVSFPRMASCSLAETLPMLMCKEHFPPWQLGSTIRGVLLEFSATATAALRASCTMGVRFKL